MSQPPARIAAVILAAGASRRLGRPKQLARLGDETLLERAVRTAVEAGCLPIVVLGCAAERIQAECDLSRCQIMLHERWERGMGASMALGIASASAMQVDGAVVMTCDQPAVTPEHLQRLIAGSALGEAAASSYAGRKGVPACFPLSRFAELAKLDGDVGARELLADARSVELPGGELDIDTEDKLRQAQERFGG